MNKVKTVVFDLGGVLINWSPRKLYEKIFSTEKEMEWFLDNVCTMSWNEEQDAGRTWLEATAMKIQEFPQYAEYIKAYSSRWTEMLGGPKKGTVDILNQLKETGDYQILALTNWSVETFPIAIERYDFLTLFDGIVISGVEKTRKPFNDIYNILFERYNVDPSSALFIDDNEKNVLASKMLGMDAIHFSGARKLLMELEERQILAPSKA